MRTGRQAFLIFTRAAWLWESEISSPIFLAVSRRRSQYRRTLARIRLPPMTIDVGGRSALTRWRECKAYPMRRSCGFARVCTLQLALMILAA